MIECDPIHTESRQLKKKKKKKSVVPNMYVQVVDCIFLIDSSLHTNICLPALE